MADRGRELCRIARLHCAHSDRCGGERGQCPRQRGAHRGGQPVRGGHARRVAGGRLRGGHSARLAGAGCGAAGGARASGRPAGGGRLDVRPGGRRVRGERGAEAAGAAGGGTGGSGAVPPPGPGRPLPRTGRGAGRRRPGVRRRVRRRPVRSRSRSAAADPIFNTNPLAYAAPRPRRPHHGRLRDHRRRQRLGAHRPRARRTAAAGIRGRCRRPPHHRRRGGGGRGLAAAVRGPQGVRPDDP